VTFAGYDGGYGNLVRIRHASGLTSGYAHLSRIAAGIRAGVAVKQSDLIGLVGSTGLATGPHLHFMMTKNGTPINPVQALKKGEPAPPIEGQLKAEFAELLPTMQVKLKELAANPQVTTAARQ
jgi:murein DD-endopeptidase MepM/ murein hydrolase activator NlpD